MTLTRRPSKCTSHTSNLTLHSSEYNTCIRQTSGSSTVWTLLNSTIPESLCVDPQPNDIAHGLNNLQSVHYENLWISLPWLQRNINIAFIQLLLNKQLQEFTTPVRKHETFTKLYNLTEVHLQKFEMDMVPQLLLSYLYLGLDPTDSLVHQLLHEMREFLPSSSASGLASISQALCALPRLDTITSRALCKRLVELCQSDYGMDDSFVRDICITVINSHHLLSKELHHSIVDILSREKESFLSTPDNIGLGLRVLRKAFHMFRYSPAHECTTREIGNLLKFIKYSCYENMDKMAYHNIAEICNCLKSCHTYKGSIASAFQTRAMSLLEGANRLSDLSNLMYCATHQMENKDKKILQDALLSMLNTDLHDIVLISNIAECLIDIGYIEKSLLNLFHDVIVNNTEHIVSYITRFTKVSKFLHKKRFTNPLHEKKFVDELIKHLDLQHGLGNFTISALSNLLLKSSRNHIPDIFYQKLLSAIPQWKEGQLYRLSLSLNSIRKPQSGKMRRQLDDIQLHLHGNLMERIDHVDSFDYLYQLTLTLLIHNQSDRHPALTEMLMHKYLNFSSCLTDSALVRCAQVFQGLKYHLPDVLEDLADNVIDRQSKLGPHKITCILNTLATVCYLPKRADHFIIACLDAFKDLHQIREYDEMLSALLNLIHLSYQPEEEFVQIFTLEFIEELEKHIAEQKQGHRHHLRVKMMELNRAVALECPQLDMPWFHEQFCLENIIADEPKDLPLHMRYKEEVDLVLQDILGSRKHFRRWVYTPYFYTLDFECILDGKDSPVNVIEISETGVSKSWQRVAVLTQTQGQYCYGSTQLDGWNQTKVRHLEMMGYKVIQVPHFEWNGFDPIDWQAKTDYLQTKIFE